MRANSAEWELRRVRIWGTRHPKADFDGLEDRETDHSRGKAGTPSEVSLRRNTGLKGRRLPGGSLLQIVGRFLFS